MVRPRNLVYNLLQKHFKSKTKMMDLNKVNLKNK